MLGSSTFQTGYKTRQSNCVTARGVPITGLPLLSWQLPIFDSGRGLVGLCGRLFRMEPLCMVLHCTVGGGGGVGHSMESPVWWEGAVWSPLYGALLYCGGVAPPPWTEKVKTIQIFRMLRVTIRFINPQITHRHIP